MCVCFFPHRFCFCRLAHADFVKHDTLHFIYFLLSEKSRGHLSITQGEIARNEDMATRLHTRMHTHTYRTRDLICNKIKHVLVCHPRKSCYSMVAVTEEIECTDFSDTFERSQIQRISMQRTYVLYMNMYVQ